MLYHVFLQKNQDKEEVLQHFEYFFFELNFSSPSSYLHNARSLSATSIQEMHSGKRRPSPGFRRRYLIARRMSRKSSRKFENLLPEKSTRPIIATNTYWLEGHQLQLDLYHYRELIDKCATNCLYLSITRTQIITQVGLSISTNQKDTSYNLILVIVGLHDELVQILIDTLRPSNSIVSNLDSVFTFKF